MLLGSIVRCRIVSPKPGTSSVSAPGSSELKHYPPLSPPNMSRLHRYTRAAPLPNNWTHTIEADLFSCKATAVLQKASAEQRLICLLMWTWGWGRTRDAVIQGRFSPRCTIGQWRIPKLSTFPTWSIYLKSGQNTAKLVNHRQQNNVRETPVRWLWRVTVVGCKCVNHLCKHWTLNAAVKYG